MKNRALKTLYIYNGIFVFAAALLGPLYAVYVGGIDRSVLAVSTSWSVFLLSIMVFTYAISRFGDRVKEKKNLLMAAFLIRGGVWFAYIFVASIPQLLILQVISGLGEALGTPAFNAIFAEHLDKGKHIREYGNWVIIAAGVMGVGTFIGGLVVTYLGFPYLFSAMSGLAILSFFGVLRQPRHLL